MSLRVASRRGLRVRDIGFDVNDLSVEVDDLGETVADQGDAISAQDVVIAEQGTEIEALGETIEQQAIDISGKTRLAKTLAELKAAPITEPSVIYDDSTFNWKVGNFTGQADDTNVVKADSTALSVGARVRQGADKVGFSPRGAPGIRKLLGSMVDEEVVMSRYDIGIDDADHSDDYEALMNGTLAPGAREYIYPEGNSINVSRAILWNGERTHKFANNSRIVGDLSASGSGGTGYVINAQGYPDLVALTVSAPIARGATSFPVSSTAGLVIGLDILLYDTVTAEYDVNQVRLVSGGVVYTKRPINYDFATSDNIQLYSLANACRNVKVFGGEIRNVNTADDAHGIVFRNATDIYLERLLAYETGGIGIYFSNSMRIATQSIAAIRTGRSSMGCRGVKDFAFYDPIVRSPQRDEGFTLYKDCTHGSVTNADIEQYLFGEEPSGVGEAGACMLLDERICDVSIINPRLRGSTTIAIFINNGSDRNTIINPNIQFANQGGIRMAAVSNDNVVTGGWITDIVDATDGNQGDIPTAGIQDDATCSGNVLGDGTKIARVASGINVRQLGTRGTVINRGAPEYRTGRLAVATPDYNNDDTGTALETTFGAASGNTFVEVNANNAGGGTPAALFLQKNNGPLALGPTTLGTYADNAAASTAGLAVGELYRTAAGAVMMRY